MTRTTYEQRDALQTRYANAAHGDKHAALHALRDINHALLRRELRGMQRKRRT